MLYILISEVSSNKNNAFYKSGCFLIEESYTGNWARGKTLIDVAMRQSNSRRGVIGLLHRGLLAQLAP